MKIRVCAELKVLQLHNRTLKKSFELVAYLCFNQLEFLLRLFDHKMARRIGATNGTKLIKSLK